MDGTPEKTRWLFHVAVLDTVERPRHVHVGIRAGRVVVLPPPGEGFELTKNRAAQLAAFVAEASRRAADDGPDDESDDVDGTTTTATTATNNRRAGETASHPRVAPRPSAPTTTTGEHR